MTLRVSFHSCHPKHNFGKLRTWLGVADYDSAFDLGHEAMENIFVIEAP
jgi:hypothetical protein